MIRYTSKFRFINAILLITFFCVSFTFGIYAITKSVYKGNVNFDTFNCYFEMECSILGAAEETEHVYRGNTASAKLDGKLGGNITTIFGEKLLADNIQGWNFDSISFDTDNGNEEHINSIIISFLVYNYSRTNIEVYFSTSDTTINSNSKNRIVEFGQSIGEFNPVVIQAYDGKSVASKVATLTLSIKPEILREWTSFSTPSTINFNLICEKSSKIAV